METEKSIKLKSKKSYAEQLRFVNESVGENMKFIKLVIMTFRDMWKHKGAYVLLTLELLLVAILFLSFFSRLQGVYASSDVRNAFNTEHMYYYTQYLYINQDLKDIISSDLREKIEIAEIPTIVISDSNKEEYIGYGYSDRIIDACQYKMSEGIWFHEYQGNNIPVISLDPNIKVGEIIQLKEKPNLYHLEVIGYMDSSSYILNFHGGASNNQASLNSFVSHPNSQLLVPYNSQRFLSVKKDVIKLKDSGLQRMVFIEDEMDAEKFLNQCHDYGSVSSVSKMKENYEMDIKNDFIVNGIVLIVFTILSITGLIGFNGIQNAIHERDYLIYYFLGGDNHQFVIIEMLKNFFVLAASFLLFLILYKKMDIFEYSSSELGVIDLKTIIVTFCFLAMICVGTSLWYIRKLLKKQWIRAYKLKA